MNFFENLFAWLSLPFAFKQSHDNACAEKKEQTGVDCGCNSFKFFINCFYEIIGGEYDCCECWDFLDFI